MKKQKAYNDINGLIVLDKKKDFTSYDCLSVIRKTLNIKKIGHTGTLDKNAEGVLVCLLGTATKSQDYLMKYGDKIYEAELILGFATDTEDMTGEITSAIDVPFDIDELHRKLKMAIIEFVGDYFQTPPMYSAKKVGGKKLLNLARKGYEIERKPNLVHITDIQLSSLKRERFEDNNREIYKCKLKVNCSKGTYIRTLCKDIGEKLGIPSCMGNLKRIQNGDFNIKNSITLDEIIYKTQNDDYSFIKPCFYIKKESAVTFGKFETLHIGHRKIIEELVNESNAAEIDSTVVIVGDDLDNDILTKQQRISKLKYLGVNNILNFKLTKENMMLTPQEFIEEILYKQLKARAVVVGADCRFGFKGQGDSEMLKNICKKLGIKVRIIEKLKIDNTNDDISSTYILEQYHLGNVDKIKKYL